jgi:hypothetical protein
MEIFRKELLPARGRHPATPLHPSRSPSLVHKKHKTISSVPAPFRVLIFKTGLFFSHFRIGTALAKHLATTSGTRVEVARGITEEKLRK